MSRLQTSLLLLGAATIAGSLFMFVSPSDEPTETVDSTQATSSRRAGPRSGSIDTSPRVASVGSDLRQHQSALRHDVNDLRQQIGELQESDPRGAEPATEPAPDPEAELDPAEQARGIANDLEQTLLDESIDAQWATERQEHFASFFDAEQLAGSWLGEVSCGSSLCRLQIASETVNDRRQLIEGVSDLLEPGAQGFAHIEDDDDLEIQVYVSRQDTGLPVLEG